ncbi:uncharacterized protein TRAVEDRAFT_47400 [Trametes versicolor FP-101664 SS1]|uniref:uncharacterized protein n=1 Tax=Trametes versicolor (strain FP-101664) TaxID=717944 RepID=UPI00046217AF|nr:uncharacterized protein TRAVEDRAFT_47400 [Trametes versicolor FP-101664 SS1]EIW58233.1 hypothetical protein TRAVEDRAFT_47400 [Trametes versicolor FP-101664 SS1]
MVTKKLSFRGFNLGKAITLSLYFTARSDPSTTDVSSYTTAATVPWKVITMPATGRYESEVTWTSKFGFSNTQSGGGVAGGQTTSSGLTYIPIEASVPVEPVPGSPHLGSQVQAINNIGRPATISLGFIEELDTDREYMHPVLTYPNVGNGLSVVGSPARMLSVHVSLNHQEAARDGLSGGIASPTDQPIWEVDLLSLNPSTVIRISQDPTTGAFVASNTSADAVPAPLNVHDFGRITLKEIEGPTRVARELRICRWCTQPWAIEDETHVLLECDADAPRGLREVFLQAVFTAVPSLRKAHFRLSSVVLLDMLLRGSTTLPILASYVADIFELCDTTPPLLPQDNAPEQDVAGRA